MNNDSVELSLEQIKVLRELGKPYSGLAFAPDSGDGREINWFESKSATVWNRLDACVALETTIPLEVGREEMAVYLEWFNQREKHIENLNSLYGRPLVNSSQPQTSRTPAEEAIYKFLKLAQAFHFRADIKD